MPEAKLDAEIDARTGAKASGRTGGRTGARIDAARAPRTQQQRREETRRALLDAAVESLIEVGFARTTTLEVQRRAKVSRGALLHHFPSKAELLVAAVDHLAEMRARELKAFASQLPPANQPSATPGTDERTDVVLGLLWQCFSGTFFKVSMELRTAARTDPELRTVLTAAERSLRERIVAQSRTLFGKAVAEHPNLERALDLTLQLMIGAAMSSVLHGDTAHLDGVISDWKALFPLVLANAGSAAPTEAKKLKGKR
ncbi:MAG TPA: TetR/AcrR family transcriptional regulator [Kofleriaceae bacterium]|jgi:AcrR family transcriptional regulator|nr:TetR/AcrR family transcriptional regulator [Kofleriaceae bacterium]